MPEETIHYSVRDQIAEIRLNNPPVNALTLPTLTALVAAFRRAGEDDSARAVLLTSAVRDRFSAGLDLKIVAAQPSTVRALLDKLYVELTDAQYHLGKPSIAVVDGAARGGGMTLAISCDVIIASDVATFGYPEIDLGVVPAIHFVHLPRIIGRHRAFELLFSGRSFTSAEALTLGLVSRVALQADVVAEAKELARVFAAKPPNAMRLARAAFMRANDLDYRRGVEYAAELFCNVAATDEAQEGLRAFAEKRPPRR
ncbi:MAG TPA: enoyl-CoA hydratase/isomerase family protein [Xanthobacteraceae bacterium]|nr:enoyl-CoA hydratase/isomerase family protein [Xanthobacteraceae bacterium]